MPMVAQVVAFSHMVWMEIILTKISNQAPAVQLSQIDQISHPYPNEVLILDGMQLKMAIVGGQSMHLNGTTFS